MLKLKENTGVVEIKGLGIKISNKSTQSELELALKHAPSLSNLIIEHKIKKNDKE